MADRITVAIGPRHDHFGVGTPTTTGPLTIADRTGPPCPAPRLERGAAGNYRNLLSMRIMPRECPAYAALSVESPTEKYAQSG